MDYRLSDKIEYTKIQNSSDVELQTTTDQQKRTITGFVILLNGAIETEVLAEADRRASRVTNILNVESGRFVRHNQIGYMKKTATGWTTTSSYTASYSVRAHVDIDLSKPKIANLITSEDDINQQCHHASLALRSEELQQYETMTTELFQVIEKESSLQDWPKYKALRDALSHQKPVQRAKSQIERYFEIGYFDFSQSDEFDHNSPKNMKNLKVEAHTLKGIVMQHLKSKLQ